jgi:hypothetical protein
VVKSSGFKIEMIASPTPRGSDATNQPSQVDLSSLPGADG